MTTSSETIDAVLTRLGIRLPREVEPPPGEWTIALSPGYCSRCGNKVARGDRVYLVGGDEVGRMWCRQC